MSTLFFRWPLGTGIGDECIQTSVSRLVERYLDLLSRPFDMAHAPPVLRLLRGVARDLPIDAHRKHLARKYR